MYQHFIQKAVWATVPVSIAVVASLASPVRAASFGVADPYNVFVFGDMTQSSDAEGRVAVGGNATFYNFGIGDRLENSNGADTRLVVGGDLSYNGGQIFGGSAVVGGSVTTDVYFNCAPDCKVTQGNPIDFGAAKSYLTNLSSDLGSLQVNGSTEYKYGGVWLQGSNADLNVFTIDGSEFNNKSYLNLEGIGSDSKVLFNVLGPTVNIANFGLNLGGLNSSNLLFNFVEATQIQTTGFTFAGSVLAPLADVSFSNGNVEGRFVANSVMGSGEFHWLNPEPETPPEEPTKVPEPGLLLGLGAIALGLGQRSKQKRLE